MARNKLYEVCASVPKTKPSTVVDEELIRHIGENYRIIPMFEKTVYEHIYRKHYSLKTNEHVNCRWEQFKDHIEERNAPFQFPDVRDFHFYNGDMRFLPPLSIFRKTDHRMKLKPGPGVDRLGQMPIPQELLMRRGIQQEEPNILRKAKNDKVIKKRTGKKKS